MEKAIRLLGKRGARKSVVQEDEKDDVIQTLATERPVDHTVLQSILAYHARVDMIDSAHQKKRKAHYTAMMDLGCGIGTFGLHFSPYFRKVYLRDIDQVMLRKAEVLVEGHLPAEDFKRLQFPEPCHKTTFDIG